jgi:diguanylate cyclase (GGDEF)-like protein
MNRLSSSSLSPHTIRWLFAGVVLVCVLMVVAAAQFSEELAGIVLVAACGVSLVTVLLLRVYFCTSNPEAALMETTLAHMSHGLIMVDADGIVVLSNHLACELLDLPLQLMASRPRFCDVVGHQWRMGEFADAEPDADVRIGSGQVPSQELVYERRRPDGRVIEIRSAPLPGGGMVRTYTDITLRKLEEERLTRAARHDPLTGVANRAAFSEQLSAAVGKSKADGTMAAVICFDLDHFKQLNDTCGHAAGDALLVEVGRRITPLFRDTDLVARLGGDEFAVLLSGLRSRGELETLAQRLLETIARPYNLNGVEASIGVSIGLSVFTETTATPDELMRCADTALYRAKAAGRNTWRWFAQDEDLPGRRASEQKPGKPTLLSPPVMIQHAPLGHGPTTIGGSKMVHSPA